MHAAVENDALSVAPIAGSPRAPTNNLPALEPFASPWPILAVQQSPLLISGCRHLLLLLQLSLPLWHELAELPIPSVQCPRTSLADPLSKNLRQTCRGKCGEIERYRHAHDLIIFPKPGRSSPSLVFIVGEILTQPLIPIAAEVVQSSSRWRPPQALVVIVLHVELQPRRCSKGWRRRICKRTSAGLLISSPDGGSSFMHISNSPATRSSCRARLAPFILATCSGVWPRSSLTLGSAPHCNNTRTTRP